MDEYSLEKPLHISVSDTAADQRFHHEYTVSTRPVVVTEMPLTLPAYTKWDWNFFRQIGRVIPVGLASDPLKRGIVTANSTLHDYVDDVQNDATDLYMVGWPYEKEHPELAQDYSLPAFHPEDFIDRLPAAMRFRRRWIFVGKQGLYSDLHVDCFTTNGWLMVTTGQKTVRLLAPSHRAQVTPQDSLFDTAVLARLIGSGSPVYEMTLTPGTVGYIPSGWMHHVRNDTHTIMVTGNFTSGTDVLRFYPNFRSLVGRDSGRCDAIFSAYLQELQVRSPLSTDTFQALNEEVTRLEEYSSAVSKDLQKLYLLREKQHQISEGKSPNQSGAPHITGSAAAAKINELG